MYGTCVMTQSLNSLLAAIVIVAANFFITRNSRLSQLLYTIGAILFLILLRNDIFQVVLNGYLVIQGLYVLLKRR
jgi:hypothetical protein